jgi:hypothetical protein
MQHHNEKKGNTVKTTERSAKTPSMRKTGFFAVLGGLLHVKGTGASFFRGNGALSYAEDDQKGIEMTPRDVLRSLLHRLGVSLPACLRATRGTGAPSAKANGASPCRHFLPSLAVLVATLGALAFTAASAMAVTTEHGEHTTGTPFGSAGTEPGQFSGLDGVAVNDATGDVYVVDSGDNRVEYFNSTGKFEGEFNGASATGTGTLTAGSTFVESPVAKTGAFSVGEEITSAGGGLEAGTVITGILTPAEALKEEEELDMPVTPGLTLSTEATKTEKPASLTAHQPFSGPQGIAVDNDPSSPSYQDVYVADPGMSTIDKFGLTGEYKGQITSADGGSLEELEGIAVDASGVLWVDRYVEEHNEVESYSGEEPNTLIAGHFLPFESESPGIAVASKKNSEGNLEDDLYVITGASRVEELNSNGEAIDENGKPIKEFCGQALVAGLAVESSSNDVYIDNRSVDNRSEVVRCSPSGKVIETLSATGSGNKGTVAVNSSNGYVYATNAEALAVDVFPPFAGAGIREEQASSVEASGATLEALIDPNAYNHTTYHFEYDTSPYTGSASHGAGTPDVEIPTGTSYVTISGRAKHLQASKVYYYRAVVESEVEGKTVTVDGPSESFTTPAEPGSAPPQNCANEQRRAEQPFGLELPDCRAYEMVSPVETEGQSATEEGKAETARAAEEGAPAQPTADVSQQDEGGAVTYATAGAFAGTSAEPPGAGEVNQYVSRREPEHERWSTQAIVPLHEPDETEPEVGGDYATDAFNPQLTEGIALTNAPLTPEAPVTVRSGDGREYGVYVADFAGGSYQYITTEAHALPLGVSSDLSHVVFGQYGKVSEWFDGTTAPVSVDNGGEDMNEASVAGWHGVSANGSRVFLASEGQLYARVNAEHEKSPTVSPEASGNGTLTEGSEEVSSLTLAAGYLAYQADEGSTEYGVTVTSGRFAVGQPVSGSGIAPNTTITQIAPPTATGVQRHDTETLILSHPLETTELSEAPISSEGPEPFAVGRQITGNGIRPGTTITKAERGKLTLSQPAASSGSNEALYGGGECTVAADACTVLVSAPHRLQENPAGTREARYRGASADGSRVLFTSSAELTEDAYTGSEGQGEDLYEYDLETGALTDLTATTEAQRVEDPNGAAVLGVAQISEDGSYLYFVAEGVLSGANAEQESPTEGAENLYVFHENRSSFITTLGAEDSADWDGSPETNTAVVSPSGSYLAFLSKESLTGYDNEQAKPGDCEGTTRKFNEGETGKCREAYLYDAEAGKLVCASCDPTGARPVGPANLGAARGGGLYRPRVLTADGTLFFDSYDALVPHASDGLQNVYEYEDGQINPISNVAGGFPSFLLDASASGGDVYFGTSDKLLPEDTSNNVVVYDARVDGGFPVTVAALSCTTAEACRTASAPTPAVFGAPPSATFSGPGNVTPPPPAVVKPKFKPLTRAQKLAKALKLCAKDKQKSKRAKCQKQARSKYGAANKTKKSTHDKGSK